MGSGLSSISLLFMSGGTAVSPGCPGVTTELPFRRFGFWCCSGVSVVGASLVVPGMARRGEPWLPSGRLNWRVPFWTGLKFKLL